MSWRVLLFPILCSYRLCLFACLLYCSIWYNIRIKQFLLFFCWWFCYLFCWWFCYLFCWWFCYLFCWWFCYLFCWWFCYLFCWYSKTEEFDLNVFCSEQKMSRTPLLFAYLTEELNWGRRRKNFESTCRKVKTFSSNVFKKRIQIQQTIKKSNFIYDIFLIIDWKKQQPNSKTRIAQNNTNILQFRTENFPFLKNFKNY